MPEMKCRRTTDNAERERQRKKPSGITAPPAPKNLYIIANSNLFMAV
jgi:hypothetical protein